MQQGQSGLTSDHLRLPELEERTDRLATQSRWIVEKIEAISRFNTPECNRRSGDERRTGDERRNPPERCDVTDRRANRHFDRREPVEMRLTGLSRELQEILTVSAELHDLACGPGPD